MSYVFFGIAFFLPTILGVIVYYGQKKRYDLLIKNSSSHSKKIFDIADVFRLKLVEANQTIKNRDQHIRVIESVINSDRNSVLKISKQYGFLIEALKQQIELQQELIEQLESE